MPNAPQPRRDHRKRRIAAAPVVSYSPPTGIGVGFAGNVAFDKGFPETTRISSVVASVTAPTEKQLLASARINSSTASNTWHLEEDTRFYWTSQ